MAFQEWDDEKFCEDYEKTWEISVSEVHYGWLAPGENTLKLLSSENISNSNILDVGCGLGQNLIALSKEGASGFGLDISRCMLSKASKVINQNALTDKIFLQQGDMREFTAFSDTEFNIILSVYSMEYLSGVQQLRSVVHNLFKRLKHGGVFIMCFSHPSQVRRHPDLVNKSIAQGEGKYRIFNYSFKDATEALIKAGFSIERIIEQQTNDPSQINYPNAKQYPYHFREGCSPFRQDMDEISNKSPHTIIYVARRMYEPTHGLPKRSNIQLGVRELWGYRRKITKYSTIIYLGHTFNCVYLAKRDNVLGLVDVLNFTVLESDLAEYAKSFSIEINEFEDEINIPALTILSLIHHRMYALAIKPCYKMHEVDSGESQRKEKRVFIESILGLEDLVVAEFQSRKLGLLTFVNGQEPSMGELPLDIVKAKKGDHIQLLYIAYVDNILQKPLF